MGPGKTYATIRAAAAAAVSGDVVVISAGDYLGDVASWPQNQLTICSAGGRVRLFANGVNEAGKGIWVIDGSNVVIDGIEFHDAKVPDQNGAGIRAEGNGLTIYNCKFFDNENGILGPDGGDLTLENCEFGRNGFGDGFSHNVYVGPANKVTVRNCFFHEAKIGHNFKSRAKETRIENSYFMDGPTGTSSYLIDVPDGGLVYLRGNLFQKGPNADNTTSVHFGQEYLYHGWPVNTLTMIHNTFVSTRSGGTFVTGDNRLTAVTSTANLFATTSGTVKYAFNAATAVTEASSFTTTAANITAPDNVAAPNFWPLAAVLPQILLASIPDATYTNDSPSPLRLRAVGGTSRRIGALQAAP